MKTITESGMVFEFEDEQVFQMEGSELHASVGTGIKTVEFIASIKANQLNFLAFIEAKKSSPRPTPANKERFNEFITEIAEKFMHSFHLYMSAVLGRHQEYKMPGHIGAVDKSKVLYKFVLVIKEHQSEWLLPLKDALEKKILYHRKIWKSSVVLMNEELAKKHHLVRDVKAAN